MRLNYFKTKNEKAVKSIREIPRKLVVCISSVNRFSKYISEFLTSSKIRSQSSILIKFNGYISMRKHEEAW